MIKFKEYLSEALIMFGGQKQTRFNQVVILAGGAGSGKGFVKENLLGLEGWSFDVDRLKELAIMSHKFAAAIKEKTGYDIKKFNLKKPEDVGKLHDILGTLYKIDKRYQRSEFRSILTADPRRKPNLIFDVTLKDISKLDGITRNVLKLGYDKKDIHIVWVVNDITIAQKQNRERDRVVPSDILLMTHEGAAFTMNKILGMGDRLNSYMDGMIWIAFNKVGVDSEYMSSKNGGHYIKTANYVKVKERGKKSLKLEELSSRIYDKVMAYIPKDVISQR